MKISMLFSKQLLIAVFFLFGIYLFSAGEYIISSALFCTAFIVSNLDFTDTSRS